MIRAVTAFTYRYRGDYQALIKALVCHEGRNLQILERYPGGLSGKPEAARFWWFRTGWAIAGYLPKNSRRRGVRVELLTGRSAPRSEAPLLQAVQAGEIEVLVATLQLIGEGFDCPGLSSLFLTTPITFEGRLLQVIGRIMRPAANKQARVFDYIDENIPALLRSARARSLVLSQL